MNFVSYTTKDLEFITAHYEELKKELERRKNEDEKSNLFFGVGDIIYAKLDGSDSFFFLKIKEIDKNNNNIVVDEIVVRDGGDFDWYIDEWFNYDNRWIDYNKVKNPEIYANLASIISQYNEKVNNLNDETYQELTNLIENEL